MQQASGSEGPHGVLMLHAEGVNIAQKFGVLNRPLYFFFVLLWCGRLNGVSRETLAF